MNKANGNDDRRDQNGLLILVSVLLLLGSTQLTYACSSAPQKAPAKTFVVYDDAASPENHFLPTGRMGDAGDILIDESSDEQPHSGASCIKIIYKAKGEKPNVCDYSGPCRSFR